MLNTELLLKVKAHILEEPRRLDMDNWLNPFTSLAPCGTSGCIAGWACVLSGKTFTYTDTNEDIETTANQLLNPTGHPAIYAALNTNSNFHRGLFYSFPPYGLSPGSREYAEWVAREIDKLIRSCTAPK